MAYWYACDVIKIEPFSGQTELRSIDTPIRIMPMMYVEASETWKITHIQSGTTRNVTFGDIRGLTTIPVGYAYEQDNEEPEVALVRTDDPLPQALLDEINAIPPGGQFIVHLDTVAKRNQLYAAYPSLQDRWPDQP